MNLGIEKRIAFVTGGAKGMGAATVRAFVAEGASVMFVDLDEKAGNALAAELGSRVAFQRVDVAKGAEVEAAIAACVKRFGALHFLVNNAGIISYGTVSETTEEVWDRTMAVNLRASFLTAHHALPVMLRSGGGVVVNVASVQAMVSQANVAAYTTSKTALLGLTRSIALDYAPTVRCVAVCPGSVDTPMLRFGAEQSPDPEAVLAECRAMHPLKRIGEAGEVADLIVFLCSDRARFITGQAYRIDGGLGIGIAGSKRD